LADRLLRLPDGFRGDRAGVEDDGAAAQRAEAGIFRLPPHHFRFIGVEAAAECDDIDGHQAALSASRVHSPVTGSNVPEHSHSAGPVMTTGSSSRYSMRSRPPGPVTPTVRPVRPVRAAETAAAQAADPQARVTPAPRSHVRMVRPSVPVTCAMVML